MKRFLIFSLISTISMINILAQNERKMVREGVRNYQDGKFPEAEVQFRKAQDEKPGLYEPEYNIANTLYKQKKFDEAATEYEKLIQKTDDPKKKADLYHNLGNSNLMTQKYDKGIDAYKNALRIRPEDEDTRYNLAYAQARLQEQKQQNQNDQNQDKDKQNQDQKEQQQNQQDKKEEKKEQQQNQEDNKDGQKEQQQSESGRELSKQEVEQMLNAVQNQEKEVKEKVDKKKAVARPLRTEKDW